MSRWFRYYDEALNDPKVQRLSGDLFKAWVNLLCLASKHGGEIPSVGDAAFALRINEQRAAAIVTELAVAKLLDPVPGGFYKPHNWDGRQFKSDSSTDRVRAHRDKKKKDAVDETLRAMTQSGSGNGDGNVSRNDEETRSEQSRAEQSKTDTESAAPPRPAVDLDEAFKRFKAKYPKRDGAQAWASVEPKFRAAVKAGEDVEAIVGGAERYAAECERKGIIGTDKVAQALTFFNQRRWREYPPPEPAADAPGFYAKADSEELAAWDRHMVETRGRALPRDRNGGWRVPAQWPPGHPKALPEVPDAA